MHPSLAKVFVFMIVAGLTSVGAAGDWTRFRGPNGSGIGDGGTSTPVTWSPSENLKWKVPLPGPGSSSPIVVGDKIFVTCWSGYGTERGNRSGKIEDLRRHLICLDRQTGTTLWDKSVEPYLPEENYGGMLAEHGYATSTPASDGERIYVFFGKTGVLAFDMEGKQLWQTRVGSGSDRMGRGTGASPILYKNLVIVNAAAESRALYGLDKLTGKEIWKSEAEGYAASWGTPVLVPADADRTDLVIGVPDEIWGLNPETGNIRWFCSGLKGNSFCSSVVADGPVAFAAGDQGSGSIAVKAGGKDDVTKSHVVWTGRENNRIGTPLVVDGKMYFVNNLVVTCLDAKSGERLYQGRLTGGSSTRAANAEDGSRPARGRGPGGPGGPGGGRGFGGMGNQDYSSPVAADGKLYFVARNGDMFVIKVGDTFEQLAMNRVTDETEDFSATPAIADGALLIRSSKHMYCIE